MAAPCELSVIIATHNRRERLIRCLEALAAQAHNPRRFEVIVASDGSDDGSAELAEAFEAPFSLGVLRLAKMGKSAALNAAIAAAEGSACLFLDDDVIASPELVGEHARAHAEDPKALCIGALEQKPPRDRNWFGSAYATAWNARYTALAKRQPDWPDCYGGNFSAPREALLAVGGFDTELPAVEDIELGYRLCQHGCLPRYLPEAGGIHDDEKNRTRILAATRGYGEFCAAFAARLPPAKPKLLGWFLDTTSREVALRRALISLRVPPGAIAPLGGLIPGRGRRQVWYGFVGRYAFWLGARSGMDRGDWLRTSRGVPLLMYHAFSEDEPSRFVITRRSFARQMRLLALLRYRVIGFEELALAVREGTELPRKAAVITIDDGYRDNLEIAQPILSKRGFPATVFVVSGHLGGENDWGDGGAVAGLPLLSPEQVKTMRAAGTAIGAHTRNHVDLSEVDAELAVEEIEGSREDLERLLGEPVSSFAYPYGRFDNGAAAAAREAGVLAACTVEGRRASPGGDPLTIPRIEVRGSDSILRFLRKLWLGGN